MTEGGAPEKAFRRQIVKMASRLARPIIDAHLETLDRQPRVFGPAGRLAYGTTSEAHGLIVNTASGTVTVGPDTFFGHRVMLLTGTHDTTSVGRARSEAVPDTGRDITVGAGVWIASGAIVLGPCTIGDHAVIAAGAVVTRDVPSHAVVAGVPGRVVGMT